MGMPDHIESALRDYDRRRDRATPPVFVGRANELAFLHQTVAAAKSGAEGITAVVQGAPGAGKSALCGQFEREARAVNGDDAPVVVVARDCCFFDRTPVSMVRELAATAALKRGSSLDLAMQAMSLDESSSLGTTLDTFAEKMWPAGITLVLSIDEMQSMEDTPLVRRNLREIHGKRFRTNIAIAGFGLQDTAARLRRLGLSRLGSHQVETLGCMSRGDASLLVDETFDHLGLTSEDEDWRGYAKALGFGADAWTSWRDSARAVILEESVDFPHHLVNGIRAVCRMVLAHDLGHPGEDQLASLRQQCRESKKAYYAARLEPLANHTMALAAALRKANADGEVDAAVVLNALEESDNNGRRTDDNTATEVLNGLLASGLLTNRGTTMVGVEIPSLTRYLADELESSLAQGGIAAHKLVDALGVDVQ